MNTLRPFFLLLGRASVFWMSAIAVFAVSMTVKGFAEPELRLTAHFSPIFAAVVGFPMVAGWIGGALIQEFQHTTFAMTLPGVRSRIAGGFVAAGFAIVLVVLGAIALTGSTPQNWPLFFAVGLGAYGLGGVLIDPLSNWITSFNVVAVGFVILRSREVAETAGEYPWIAILCSLGIGTLGLLRMSARSTFRSKPKRPTAPFPGRFSLEKSMTVEHRRRIELGAGVSRWRTGYLGDRPWRWVRAAFHESRGTHGWRSMLRSAGKAWGLGLLVVGHSWIDQGEMGLGKAIAWTLQDVLLRSPHQPTLGEHGSPYAIVIIVLGAAGALAALFRPVALSEILVYPLSRQRRAQIIFRGGLVDTAISIGIVGLGLLAVGYLMGWIVGHEATFDYMPFVLRVLLVTLSLTPLAYWGRLRLFAAARRREENTMLGVIFGVTAFVIAVGIGTAFCAAFTSPLTELIVMTTVLVGSRLLYRHFLTSHYRTTDLA